METATAIEYKWDDTMRTGDAALDQQHLELINQMNLLLRALAKGEGPQQVDALMKFLSSYVDKHFKQEEALMQATGCPIADTNLAAHAEFVNKLIALRTQIDSNPASGSAVAIQMLRDLSSWFIKHIRRVDTQLLGSIK